ncbi:hypothetical protein OAQ35_00900 [Litorivicinus sp.]|nr:hypothetical protein [Litorivicinus sp.]
MTWVCKIVNHFGVDISYLTLRETPDLELVQSTFENRVVLEVTELRNIARYYHEAYFWDHEPRFRFNSILEQDYESSLNLPQLKGKVCFAEKGGFLKAPHLGFATNLKWDVEDGKDISYPIEIVAKNFPEDDHLELTAEVLGDDGQFNLQISALRWRQLLDSVSESHQRISIEISGVFENVFRGETYSAQKISAVLFPDYFDISKFKDNQTVEIDGNFKCKAIECSIEISADHSLSMASDFASNDQEAKVVSWRRLELVSYVSVGLLASILAIQIWNLVAG